MKLQQLRYFREVVRQGLSISHAAQALHTSQPGISKQLRLLEGEFGAELFLRKRNRVIEITPAGKAMLVIATRMLEDAENLQRLGRDYSNDQSGNLTVLTTHTQARYTLPRIVKRFAGRYPKVRLSLRQGTPSQIWPIVANGEADLAIASEPREIHPDMVMLKCYDLPRIVLTPPRHPLLKLRNLTLEELVRYPIITYDEEFIGHSKVKRAFSARKLSPNLVLNAIDTDVIKAYVELGLGIAIVASMAFEPGRDRDIRGIDAGHLFESNTVYLGFRRNYYLRRYALDFIEMLAPHLNREAVLAAIDDAKVSA